MSEKLIETIGLASSIVGLLSAVFSIPYFFYNRKLENEKERMAFANELVSFIAKTDNYNDKDLIALIINRLNVRKVKPTIPLIINLLHEIDFKVTHDFVVDNTTRDNFKIVYSALLPYLNTNKDDLIFNEKLIEIQKAIDEDGVTINHYIDAIIITAVGAIYSILLLVSIHFIHWLAHTKYVNDFYNSHFVLANVCIYFVASTLIAFFYTLSRRIYFKATTQPPLVI